MLDNATTVLLVAPVTFLVCDRLKVPVAPFLTAEALASNIGGTAALVGDPPNIIIGSRAPLEPLPLRWPAGARQMRVTLMVPRTAANESDPPTTSTQPGRAEVVYQTKEVVAMTSPSAPRLRPRFCSRLRLSVAPSRVAASRHDTP